MTLRYIIYLIPVALILVVFNTGNMAAKSTVNEPASSQEESGYDKNPVYVQIATTTDQTTANVTLADKQNTEEPDPEKDNPEIKATLNNDEKPTPNIANGVEANPKANSSPDSNRSFTALPKTDQEIFVPFFSQFTDISDPNWKKVGCGIASLAMLIEFYAPNQITVDGLLQRGIASKAYLDDAGWIHSGLIKLSNKHGLNGKSHDISTMGESKAFDHLANVLKEGPVMASVHYTFDPQNPIPHLVVVNNIVDDTVYYNDPSEKSGNGAISSTKFLKAWKKRYIEIRPV